MELLKSSVVQWLFFSIALGASLGQNGIFMHQPQDVKTVIGNSAFFPCTYTGTTGVPHWSVNQTYTYPEGTLPSKHTYNGTGLIVRNVDISMNTTSYKCCFEVEVHPGAIEEICSSTGMLIIITSGFTQYPTSVVTTPGEMGRFQCTAIATSVCDIQWRINHTLIIDSEANAYSIPARAGTRMLSSTLHVFAAPQHNNSEVDCCTYSETGEEICTSSVNLTVTGVQNIPGAPTLSLLSSTSSSLTIAVELSPEGVPPILSIAVNFTNPPGLVQSVSGPFSPGQRVTTTLSGLEAGTEHNFTVFAFNFNGISPASSDTSFRTDQGAEDSLYPGIIAGIAVAFVVVCITTVICLICYKKRQSSPRSELCSPRTATNSHRDIAQSAADTFEKAHIVADEDNTKPQVYQVQPDGSGIALQVPSDSSPDSPSAEDNHTRHHLDRMVPDVDQLQYEDSPYPEWRKFRLPPIDGRETTI